MTTISKLTTNGCTIAISAVHPTVTDAAPWVTHQVTVNGYEFFRGHSAAAIEHFHQLTATTVTP